MNWLQLVSVFIFALGISQGINNHNDVRDFGGLNTPRGNTEVTVAETITASTKNNTTSSDDIDIALICEGPPSIYVYNTVDSLNNDDLIPGINFQLTHVDAGRDARNTFKVASKLYEQGADVIIGHVCQKCCQNIAMMSSLLRFPFFTLNCNYTLEPNQNEQTFVYDNFVSLLNKSSFKYIIHFFKALLDTYSWKSYCVLAPRNGSLNDLAMELIDSFTKQGLVMKQLILMNGTITPFERKCRSEFFLSFI